MTSGGNDFNDFTQIRLTKFRVLETVKEKNSRHVKGGIAQCPLNAPLRVIEPVRPKGECRGLKGRAESES